MSYVSPPAVVSSMVEAGTTKTGLGTGQLILRSTFSTFLLGGATALAILATAQTGVGVVGALLFPLGLTVVVLLGVELLTGNFGLVPLAVIHRRTSFRRMLRNFWWVLVGHVLGGLLSAFFAASLSSRLWTDLSDPLAQGIIDSAVSKTLAFQEMGAAGGITLAFLSGMFCNWLVVLGVVMGMTSTNTAGKVLAIWMPIAAFYALGLEHAVVNLFVIPAGMMLGAPIGIDDWWLWNQLPVLAGNLLGGLLLMALPLYLAYRPAPAGD
jgi:formate/nitrite transporter FocA (FNT family)